jgi:hypothetical protein
LEEKRRYREAAHFAALADLSGARCKRSSGLEQQPSTCESIRAMADQVPSPAALEERVAGLADVVNKLIGVVSRLDDETSDTAAAAFDSDVPRVAGHKATAEELKSLSETLDAWLKKWGAGNAG